jgi:hypothetical protein
MSEFENVRIDRQQQDGPVPRTSGVIENCRSHLQQQGGMVPRTCPVCGLTGPCRFFDTEPRPRPEPLPTDPKDIEIARLKAKLYEIRKLLGDLG